MLGRVIIDWNLTCICSICDYHWSQSTFRELNSRTYYWSDQVTARFLMTSFFFIVKVSVCGWKAGNLKTIEFYPVFFLQVTTQDGIVLLWIFPVFFRHLCYSTFMAKVEQKQSKAAQPSICSLKPSLNSDLNTHTQQQQQQQQQQKRLLALYAFRSCKIRTIVYSYSETTLRKNKDTNIDYLF